MYIDAKFNVDSGFAIKHGLNPWFDGFSDSQRQIAQEKRSSVEKG